MVKKDKYLKSDFEINEGNIDSRAMNRVKHYLQDFKGVIQRGGNNLKTPKFHQMLHICNYITRHGSPLNFDGGRGENFGKVKIKDNAKLTNKQKITLNFDISRRICEEDIVDQASNVYFVNKGHWPSSFCNDTDIALHAKRIQTNNVTNRNVVRSVKVNPRFKLICNIEDNDHDNNMSEDVNVHIDWGGKSKTPVKSYPTHLLKLVASRLYIGSPNLGG